MQPFDALTIRAVLQEAKPLLLNRKVDKVYQLGRDELLLALRGKAGTTTLFLSAQTAYGRICLIRSSQTHGQPEKVAPRYLPTSKSFGTGANTANQSSFNMIMRKYMTGATLVGIEQPMGERMVDFIFSCTDEVGTSSHKVLTAEIMGRHSNLIFWDKSSEKILAASHVVTKEMSRQREIAPGLKFVRPPGQEKASIFVTKAEEFAEHVESLRRLLDSDTAGNGTIPGPPATIEQWLIATYTGLGRHLAEELVNSCGLESKLSKVTDLAALKEKLWEKIAALTTGSNFSPYMRKDLSRYSVLGWWQGIENEEEWKHFPAVNDLIEEYFRSIEAREQFQQLKERLRTELRTETEKLASRLAAADLQLQAAESPSDLKKRGDLILANINEINAGQEKLICQDLYDSGQVTVEINLNPNMSPSQNAQHFYRLFAKNRARQGAASMARQEATTRLAKLNRQMNLIEEAKEADELKALRETVIGRKQENKKAPPIIPQKKAKSRLLQITSSDGWTIYAGRNRHENDHLLSHLAQPSDIWLHILGQGGAHVLIRVPASKQDPPATTLREAAQVAARMSKAGAGAKVRVVYTQCRYVKKLSKDKPGLVRYENERTLEIDTGEPLPAAIKQALY
jgi:predicted ribosome quality control (RQC) complex YloA/Tae2 family protein